MPMPLSLLVKFIRNFDGCFLWIGEEIIDLLQRQIGCFRIAEIYQRHEGKVRAHEYQVSLPLQPVDDDGCDHDNEEIPDPVRRNPHGGSFRSGVKRQDLRHVDPRDAVDRCAEDEHVEKEERNGG